MTGYLNPAYARSLAEFGRPVALPACGGWVLERDIPGTNAQDAMGCYPLFACRDWSLLAKDLESFVGRWLSLAVVTDPFGVYDQDLLQQCFDRTMLFKQHWLVELGPTPASFVSKHHRYYARRALQDAQVEWVSRPTEHHEEWMELYGVLIERHGLRGIKAMSRRVFAELLALPELVMLRMTDKNRLLGIQLWLIQGDVSYLHLMAVSEEGYARNTSYGLCWSALQAFAERLPGKLRWLDFGAGAGIARDATDGLTQFKRGWANASRPVYFCGRILDAGRYRELSQAVETNYFPAYRHGEFC